MKNSIYINGRFLTQQTTGVQQFAREICRYLSSDEISFRLLVPQNTIIPEWLNHIPISIVGKRNGYWWEQIELPLYLKKQGSPLLINFCNTAPLCYNSQIVTIHDLAFMHHPEWFSKSFAFIYRFLIPRIGRRSKKVITVSHTVSRQLQQILHIPAQKISVLYNGISYDLLQALLPGGNSRKKIILSVSSINPRKNLETLVWAFYLSNLPGYELVIAGTGNPVFAKNPLPAGQDVRIRYAGYVSNAELIDLYQQAALFVSLSFDEGFGIPVLEALYNGCPVLLSDIEVYKECFEELAIFTSPFDVEKAALDLQRAVLEPPVPVNAVALEQQYSYETSAKKLIKMLREAS